MTKRSYMLSENFKKISEKIKREFEIERTPDELIKWVRDILEESKDLTGEESHKALKKIRDEAFPIIKYLEHSKTQFKAVKLNSNNDNFDGAFVGHCTNGYFEVTCAKDGRLSLGEALHMDKHDWAPGSGVTAQSMIDEVRGKKNNKEAVPEDYSDELKELADFGEGVQSHVEYPSSRAEEIAEVTNQRIKEKLQIAYNKNTILVVGVCDRSLDVPGVWDEFLGKVNCHSGQTRFAEIYIVGLESTRVNKIS